MEKTSNHNESGTDQTDVKNGILEASVLTLNVTVENDSRDKNNVHCSVFKIDEKCPIKNDHAKEWYLKYDTAWHFSTAKDYKLVVNESQSQQNDAEIKSNPNLKEPLKKQKPKPPKQSKQGQEKLFLNRKLRFSSPNELEESQSNDNIALFSDSDSSSLDDLFISQDDYEISVRAKLTQYILLFILFLQSIIFLINHIYSLAIGILVINWITLFYFITIRS